ncbi:similar to Saccharomyces cerevisiae YFL007W BLM10 Proteasome activator subunit [Maudiozyma saulgeensis]|uniref:Similar to Saccharomyces cerevisiae YFL007W BLM10 Proteasome activator subunit n=1 Tax=Maudiozyma saulgeensis TaxID=1789683 RepID=A0A1X7RAL9_9SACH|nr:similar to Saccharomyces cerevisiae YFL007W BLM10 Proteasome activator subunit [Kazachstania saulgeensis]
MGIKRVVEDTTINANKKSRSNVTLEKELSSSNVVIDTVHLTKRLQKYNLDYKEDITQHLKEIYDPNSKWFSRPIALNFDPKNHLPYQIETHLDRARYICHIVLNLYISISSLDIQGLITITDKDIRNIKFGINEFITTNQQEKDIANFDEGEEDGEPDEFEENGEYMEFVGPDFNAVGRITPETKCIINVNHWTNELKNCLDFNFPLSLRKSLVIVYYHLSMVQGQKIYRQLHVEVMEKLLDRHNHGTNFTELLKQDNLILDHNKLFQFLCEFLPYPDSDYIRYDITSKDDLNLFRLLLKLSHMAKLFFNQNDTNLLEQTMNTLLASIAPNTLPIILPIMTSFVPYHYHKEIESSSIIDYLPFCFGLWGSTSANIAIDTHMYDFVGNILEDYHGRILRETLTDKGFNQFGLFTKDQMVFLFNRLQGHLRTNGQIHSFSRTVRPFIYSINGSDNEFFFQYLNTLTKAIETFVHPSNSGFWTKPIAKFVHSFIKMYHGRVKREQKIKSENHPVHSIMLTEECHDKLTDIFLNILFIGAQNKNPDISNYYISCFGYLVELSPKSTKNALDKILVELYDSLGDEYINFRHRIIASLKQFSRVVRFMVMDKLYRVHIINILYMLTTKLDMNDINLSSNLVNGIVSIASFIPFEIPLKEEEYINFESNTLPFVEQHFYHLKEGHSSSDFQYDEDTLEAAFRGSTTILGTVLRSYIDKLFKMVDTELDEGFITKVNQTSMIIIQAMDDSIFKMFTEQFTKQFWDSDTYNERNPNFEILTTCLASLVKRDISLSKSISGTLIIKIQDQIERGAGSVRSNTEIQRRDLRLVLYLTALNDVLRQSYEAILTFSDELINSLEYIFKNITNPPLDVITSILVHSACASLTTTEIREARLFSKDNTLTYSEKWGALQFNPDRFLKKNLSFEWHIPNEEEVELCINIFTRITNTCIEEIEHLLKESSNEKDSNDNIQKYILILTHSLSGASLLFDADYTSLLSKKSMERMGALSSADSSRFASLSPYVFLDQDSDNGKDVGPDLVTLPVEIDVKNPVHALEEKIVSEETANEIDTTTTSEVPSRIATPAFNHEESPVFSEDGRSASSVNRILGTNNPAFKDLDIFAYNYFFGNAGSEKLNNPLYHKINNERLHIGHFYHKIFKFLSSNHETNINIYQALLHGLKVWFTDIGKETIFNDDPNLNLEYDFLENIQSLRHLEEPFTRSLFAVKVNNLHQSRVLMHSTIRNPSKLESKLLNDVISLSCSIYPDIHKPAQGCLLHCMKQLIGSYSNVIGCLLRNLRENMEKQQNKKIEVILRVLCLRKIQRRLLSDYSHLQEVTLMLLDCYKINELDISIYAEKLLLDLVTSIKIPSSICVYDSKMFTPIDPSDIAINDRVELIKASKDKKRKAYNNLLSGVQDSLISLLDKNDERNWKIPTFIIQFISKLQASLEIQTSKDSIKSIFNQTKEKHPEMVHLVVRSFLAIANKVISLSDYGYDISRAYQSSYDPPFVSEIETASNGDFQNVFKAEMSNFDNPTYFIDGKAYVGWLCWGKPIKVLKNAPIKIDLHENETEVFMNLGKLVSKEWLEDIMKCLIQDNETRCVFSSGDVSFMVVLIVLITRKYTSNLKLDDLFELCSTFYNRYDKSSTIMSIEILAALICGSRYMNDEEQKSRDAFVDKFMKDALNNEFNQDAFEIWGTLCWWLPSVVDIRRCAVFFRNFNDTKTLMTKSSEQFGNQASRILMLGSVLMSMEFRSPNINYIIETIVFDHPYDQVREAIGRLISIICQIQTTPSYTDVKTLLTIKPDNSNNLGVDLSPTPSKIDLVIKDHFHKIDIEYEKITGMTPQEILKTQYYYMSSTMFHWVQDLIRSPNKIAIVPYVVKYILPFLLRLMKEKDVCTLGGIDASTDFLAISYLPMKTEQIQDIIDLMCSDCTQSQSTKTSYEIKLKLAFIQHFISSELLQLTDIQREFILDFVVSQVYNPTFVEVRIRAADVLSDIVHNVKSSDELNTLIERFSQKLDGFSWEQKKQLSKTDTVIHASVVALGAIISAFPYVFPLPRWMPEQLSKLASWARTSGVAGRSAKDTISEFKKVRADTWKFDRTQFTTEELEDLEGVLWRSYYA